MLFFRYYINVIIVGYYPSAKGNKQMTFVKMKVLLLSSPEVNKKIGQLLKDAESRAFEVIHALDLDESFALLQNDRFEALLIETEVFGQTLIESLRKIDLASRQTPIILLGDKTDAAFENQLPEISIQDYLVKETLDTELLLRVLRYSKRERETRDKLRGEYAFRKAIEDSMIAGIAAADINGKMIYVNPAFCKMTGWSEEELLGTSLPHPFWPPEETEKIMNAFQNRMNKSGPPEAEELIFRRKNEERFPVLELASPLLDGNGNQIGALGSFVDISKNKKMEEELGRAQKLESLGILAGGIAHDFNNILTGILGNISLAKNWIDASDRAFIRLTEAEKASLRATELANQLLTFAKGGSPVKNPASIIDMLGRTVQFALRGSNVRGQFFLKENLWSIEVDEGQISQVIQNLVINAQQAMPDGGALQVYAENLIIETDHFDGIPFKKGDYVKISFKDFGVGIQKNHLSKIFDPYFTTKQKGSGLGLSIVFSVIKKHDGYITVESIPGAGTTFHIYLPASVKKTLPRRGKEEEGLMMGRGKVLLIDDEEGVREVAKVMLRHLGYETDLANESGEAVAMFQKKMKNAHPYDLVITDLTIPGDIGGVEILRKLKEIDPQIRVIVSSGYSNNPIMADPRANGFSDMIKKPYSIKDLGDTLFRALVGAGSSDPPDL